MKTISLAVLLLAAPLLVRAQAISLDKPVVVVNGSPITYLSYYKRMEGLTGFGRRVGDQFVPASPGFLTLQQLVNEQLMLELAVDKGVAPTEQEIEDEYAATVKDNPEQVKDMLKWGTTPEDIKRQVRVRFSEFNLQTMGINISAQQVEQFYRENPSIYTTPKSIDLYAISVETPEQQDAVDKKLNSNTPFSDVAKELSLDLTAPLGGFVGRIIEANLGERLRKQVEGLKERETTSWLDADSRKVKYYLGKVYPQLTAPLTPELKKAIRSRLMIDRGRIKNDLAKWMAEKRKTLKLGLQGTPFDEDLKQLFESGS